MSTEQNKSNVRRLSRLWMLVTVAMLIALLTSGISANLAFASSNMVPFKGTFSGTAAITGPTTGILSGSGVATHLGLTQYAGNVSNITPTPTGMTNVVVEILTAANGDTLTLLCTEAAVQTSPGVFLATDQWVVTGGTGRFAGATGSGTAATQADLNKGTFTKQVTGTISAPNGS